MLLYTVDCVIDNFIQAFTTAGRGGREKQELYREKTMFESILDCPKCKKRFHLEFENGEFPAIIVCPECGEESPSEEFWVLLLCHQCHCKLKVPVSIINEKDNLCPKCGAVIRNDFLDTMNNDALTVTGAAGEDGAARMLQDGDFFDKYKIIRFLGRGGMAEVYLAEHLLLKQTCALKLMRRNLDQDDNPVFIKRFVREAKLTHSLEHPNIVRVFDAGSDFKTGYLFLAMEYVEGDTLLEIMKHKELTAAELLELLIVIAGALKPLEESKVVHRDIKPSNIMYTREGVYKLMDLGIAKVESDHQAGDMTLTMEKSTIGTPGYASPEQCRAAHRVDIRSDIFSLGATLYHAATGFSPFRGETPVAVILNMMQSDPEPIRTFREDLPDELIAIIEKMMKKDPDARFQNIGELLAAAREVDPEKNGRSPIRKIRAALVNWTTDAASLTTLFREPRKNKDESAGRRIFKGILKTVAVLFLVLLSALHLYYVFDAMSGKSRYGSYGKFLNSLLFKTEKETVDFPPLNPVIPDRKQPVRFREQRTSEMVRGEKAPAGIREKKTQSLKNDTTTPRSQKIHVQKEHKVQENRDRNFRPRQSVRVQENKVQHKSEAYFPVLRPGRREPFPQRQSVDEHLALLRKEHRAYAEAVRKFQDSLKNMPETVPPGVRQKRRDIARLAAELCQMREKRFIYLEQRRRLVNAAKNRSYDDAAGKRVQKAVAQFVSSDRKTREEKEEFGNRLFKLLSDPAVDPNIKVGRIPGKNIELSILGVVTAGDLGFQEKCLEMLIKRGADPGGALHPRYTGIMQRMIDYGLTGENLDNFFYQGAERERLTTLFLDGAFPHSGSLGRCLKTKDYEHLLFLLACGADPNQYTYGVERPLIQASKMAGGEKFRELLLAAGADPALTDRKGKRASDYALVREFAESWEKQDLIAIHKALQSGAISPDHNLENGYNLLGEACLKGDEMVVKMLLEHGVDLYNRSNLRLRII